MRRRWISEERHRIVGPDRPMAPWRGAWFSRHSLAVPTPALGPDAQPGRGLGPSTRDLAADRRWTGASAGAVAFVADRAGSAGPDHRPAQPEGHRWLQARWPPRTTRWRRGPQSGARPDRHYPPQSAQSGPAAHNRWPGQRSAMPSGPVPMRRSPPAGPAPSFTTSAPPDRIPRPDGASARWRPVTRSTPRRPDRRRESPIRWHINTCRPGSGTSRPPRFRPPAECPACHQWLRSARHNRR